MPGTALRESPQRDTLDVLGIVRDEQGRPVGRIRETLDIAPDTSGVAARQLLYQAGLTLPPGRFLVKVVVRENATGTMGSFESGVFVPDLRQAPVKVSSVTLSTQIRPTTGRQRSDNPLIREGVELLPEPHARRRSHPEDVLLLRGLRTSGRGWRFGAAENESGVLSWFSEGVRDAAR